MKLFTIIIQILPVFAQNIILGSQVDEHKCVSDGGYQWCDATQSCVRPWVTSCPTINIPLPDPLPEDPLPEDPLPMPIDPQCYGVMCDLYCKNGMVLDSTGCPTCRCIDLKKPPSNNIPENCASWNDGCNTCMVNKDGSIGGCTRMMCFIKNDPKCNSYYSNNH